jgi:hypothetical protein
VRPWDGIDGDPLTVLAEARAREASEASSSSVAVSAITACTNTTGYESGSPRRICVATVDGKMVEINTANAYLAMKAAASRDGVSMYIVSGFRTMEHQRQLYNLDLAGRGNLAAPPGYSNHQNGLALDLNTSDPGVYNWLARNASRFGFRRTVPSEEWHWEHNGSAAARTDPNEPGERCWSESYRRWMEAGTCLQSPADNVWYQCASGAWRAGQGAQGPCTRTFARGTNTSTQPAAPPRECYSSTLARNVPYGACVQSWLDQRWYQCNLSGWLASTNARGPAGGCVSSTALSQTTPSAPANAHTCYSSTLGRALPFGACVQSAIDRLWYQCNFSGWIASSATRGVGGGCTQTHPLR